MNKRLGLVAMLCLLWSAQARAQVDVNRFDRQLEQIRRDTRLLVNPSVPADQRAYFDYGAYITFNYLSADDSSLDNHGLRQTDFTAYAHISLDGVHEFFFRGREFYRDFNKGDSFPGIDNGWDGRIERLYYQFDLSRYLSSTSGRQTDGNITIKVGRDLAYWGNGLVLSEELDGGVVTLEAGPATLQILAGRTPSDIVDIDSSRPNFEDHTDRFFYGAMLSARAGTHRPFIYGLAQRDHNSDDTAVNQVNGTNVTTKFDYNSYYIGIGSAGALTDRLAYGVEAVYEGGDGLSNSFNIDSTGTVNTPGQTRDDINAWAFDGQLNYLLPDTRHTRFSGELVLASGDSDRLTTSNTFGGNQPGTNDGAFNAFGLINTGLAFAPNVSNIIILRGGVSMFPMPDVHHFERMQLGTDLFLFAKMNANAPIDEQTNDSKFLGFEPDVYLNWQMTSDLTLAIRYGAFFPGDAIVADGKIRQFFYTGVTFAF